jgi:hypothetical protein
MKDTGGLGVWLHSFITRWGGGSVVSFTLRPLYPPKRELPISTDEAWWAPETVFTFWRREKSLASAWSQTPTIMTELPHLQSAHKALYF